MEPADLPLAAALDLAVHWLLTTRDVDKEQRERIESGWNGPLTSVARGLPAADAWAPSWWHGDEDAVKSTRAAAMALDMGRKG